MLALFRQHKLLANDGAGIKNGTRVCCHPSAVCASLLGLSRKSTFFRAFRSADPTLDTDHCCWQYFACSHIAACIVFVLFQC